MLYRRMKSFEGELSILGAGCMRLPVTEDGRINEPVATAMLHYAIDHGVNYVDTAYPYHGGESEPLVGRALQGDYRERVALATKLPSWLVHTHDDCDRYLDEQLGRLQTDHIDFYLVHALSGPVWARLVPLGIEEFLDRALADGRIRQAGFSFHGEHEAFKEIVDAYHWDFCQIQYNFMDEEYQAGTAGLLYAAARGLGIVAMEPLRGGALAKAVPGVREIWDRAPVRRAPAEWALRWVWDHPEVTVALSGMSTMDQVVENVALADVGLPGSLSREELACFEAARAEYVRRTAIPCTACNYCLPCPTGVNIPACFTFYNQARMYEAPELARGTYGYILSAGPRGPAGFASQCVECGVCEERCPQAIPIQEKLKGVVALFGR
jgi:uncharacterized protein